jgi:hypothetical protein
MSSGSIGAAHLVTGALPASAARAGSLIQTMTTGDSVWVNGEPQPAGATHVSARDRGFTLADGLF